MDNSGFTVVHVFGNAATYGRFEGGHVFGIAATHGRFEGGHVFGNAATNSLFTIQRLSPFGVSRMVFRTMADLSCSRFRTH